MSYNYAMRRSQKVVQEKKIINLKELQEIQGVPRLIADVNFELETNG